MLLIGIETKNGYKNESSKRNKNSQHNRISMVINAEQKKKCEFLLFRVETFNSSIFCFNPFIIWVRKVFLISFNFSF